MEARIELELRGRKPSEVVDLLLDNCNVSKISGLTEEFSSLTTISLINAGLTTLEGLPHLESLRTIDLSDNKLTGGLDILVEKCPRLYHINLCANRIKDIEALSPLKKLEELSALDLFDCDVTESADYRQKVFELIPQLKYLDGFDVNDVEAEMSDDNEGEDAIGEDADISDEDELEETENGLAYLNSSKALQDEDESEDFIEAGNGNAQKSTTNGKSEDATNRGTKRKLESAGDAVDEEPSTKTA